MPGLRSQPASPNVSAKTEAIAQNLERLAWLMDRAIPIPGTKFRVGLDAILGLLPGGGDLVSSVVQTALVLTTLAHYRVPKAVAFRMAANVLIDLAVGAVPVVGDLFDAGFKANTRNLALLSEVRKKQSLGEPMPSAPSIRYLVLIGVILFSAIGLMFVGLIAVVAWLFSALKSTTPTAFL